MIFSSDALEKLRRLRDGDTPQLRTERLGRIAEVVGTVIEAHISDAPLGALVRIFDQQTSFDVKGEVVGFRKNRAIIVPFAEPTGVCANSLVQCIEREPRIRVGEHLIGRIVDSYCNPIVGEPFAPESGAAWSIHRPPINPLSRRRITRPLDLGVRAMNGLLTCGEGQRIGIMAGSGVGKSVLLGMIARYTAADVNVIALIGERGREVREFLDDNLGPDGLAKSVVIVSTSDESPLVRIRAAHVATAIAEFFRDRGKRVLLMMDSLTRVAMAQREVGLAVGEPPTTKGYTPSVFSLLPRILERAGNGASQGSLTAIYTVLVDGDDFNDPICDAARGILDGHINLKRNLATRNHFPAIDVLTSASRVMQDIVSQPHQRMASTLRTLLASYTENEDLINIGGYVPGANPTLDLAIQMKPAIDRFLRQDRHERSPFEDSVGELEAIGNQLGGREVH